MKLVGVLLIVLVGIVSASDFDSTLYPTLNCDKLTLENGYVEPEQDFYGIKNKWIYFMCNKPYTLIGDKKTKCYGRPVKVGTFIAYIPTWKDYNTKCVACKNPGAPAKGSIDQNNPLFSVGATVNWKCNTGYDLIGASKSTCKANGEFDKKKPLCKLVQCKNPGAPDKGEVDPGKPLIDYSKSITWTCNTGYNLIGATKAKCQANGEFDKEKPICKLVQCKNPGAPDKGEVDPGKPLIDYSKSITWTCNTGYNLIGATKAKCQANGEFDKGKPFCKPIYCFKPDPPKHGSVKPKDDKIFYGKSYTFECDKGYKLVGVTSRECLLSGELDGKTPVCMRVKCKNPGAPRFGYVNPSDNIIDYGVTITWSCRRHLKLIGAETAICQQNGKFSKQKPICKPRQGCGPLAIPVNGIMKEIKDFYNIKDSVTFSCEFGILEGSSKRTCVKHGVWDGKTAKCNFDIYDLPPFYEKK